MSGGPAAKDRPLFPGNSFNPPRPLAQALSRGLNRRCPACGIGHLFYRFLKVTEFCGHCGEALHHARPDDAPPYFVMLIVGHIVVPFGLLLEEIFAPPLLLTAGALSILASGLCLALLPPVKGIIVALQWSFWMHGFDPDESTKTPVGAAPSGVNQPAPQSAEVEARFGFLGIPDSTADKSR